MQIINDNKIVQEKLIFAELMKQFSAFYEIQMLQCLEHSVSFISGVRYNKKLGLRVQAFSRHICLRFILIIVQLRIG
jgi:hypothetical protein